MLYYSFLSRTATNILLLLLFLRFVLLCGRLMILGTLITLQEGSSCTIHGTYFKYSQGCVKISLQWILKPKRKEQMDINIHLHAV